MSSSLLISLTIALVAAYFYLNTFEEIPRILAFSIGAVCLFFSLVMTPWSIQLLILLFIFLGTSKLSKIDIL